MNLFRFVKITVCLTILALIYIHLQMQIFDLAYQGKKKEKQIISLLDDNNTVNSNILMLKSANNLGVKLLTDSSGMKFLDEQQIVRLQTPGLDRQENRLAYMEEAQKESSIFKNFFSLRAEAEAQPLE